MFYCKDLFKKVGIVVEFKSWDEFLEVCKKFKVVGIVFIVVGGCDVWILVGWFDYFDLCINGNVFYQQLMVGDVVYIDLCVKKVYIVWKSLIDNKYFIDNVLLYDLDGVQFFLFQGKVVMMFMGIFIVKGFLVKLVLEMGYFQFLIIDVNVLIVEEGLIEFIYILVKVCNKIDVCCFIVFVGMLVISVKLVDGLGLLLVNSKLLVLVDLILCIGFEIFFNVKGGILQFYDCDMIKEMVDEGMKGMQKFVSDLIKIDDVFNELEQSCKCIYKKF